MLVLHQRPNQDKTDVIITLPDGRLITIMALGLHRGDTFRMGYEAPRDIRVDRREVHDRRCLESAPVADGEET